MSETALLPIVFDHPFVACIQHEGKANWHALMLSNQIFEIDCLLMPIMIEVGINEIWSCER